MEEARDLWIDWRAQRDAVRITYFDSPELQEDLDYLYRDERKVDVLLGGPPCQGFSRIGRGKLRSLKEQSVHVQEDETAGDSRNQLMLQYVLFLGALEPRIFLFENVRHFQSTVKTDQGSYQASEILAEAIKNVTFKGASYEVASQVIDASDHGVPQARQRYFMAGVRYDVASGVTDRAPSHWCLALPKTEPTPLRSALEDLPEPLSATGDVGYGQGRVPLAKARVSCRASRGEHLYLDWIEAPGLEALDGHIARSPRQDDAAFFSLLGPGKRWMDYRCDEAETLSELKQLLAALKEAADRDPKKVERLGVDTQQLGRLHQTVDGSLSVRLLLEQLPRAPGEMEHHLCNPNYLRKREGQHGDWLARMDPTKPSKTMMSHMSKDTYAYVHPDKPRTISVREAARIQSFPDDFKLRGVGLVEGFRVIGNAVPPLLGAQLANRVAQVIQTAEADQKGSHRFESGRAAPVDA